MLDACHPPPHDHSNGGFSNNCMYGASACGAPISLYGVPPDAGSGNATIVSVVVPVSLSADTTTGGVSSGPPVWPMKYTSPSLYYDNSPPATTARPRPPCYAAMPAFAPETADLLET